MPESPDFESIAQQLADRALPVAVVTMPEPPFKTRQQFVDLLAEQLRLVWNARGAADGQAVESRIRELVAGEVVGAGIARHVADAIRKADC